jgi:hypothetical protein
MTFDKTRKNEAEWEQLISVVVPVYNVCNYFEDCLH